jgi:hypothetical protein
MKAVVGEEALSSEDLVSLSLSLTHTHTHVRTLTWTQTHIRSACVLQIKERKLD